jgi:phage tail-like protein
MAQRSITSDPLRNFKFHVAIYHNIPEYGPINHVGFMSASGLAATTETISYREGGDNTTPRKMPGQTDFPPLSLTRGLVGNQYDLLAMWRWYREIFYVINGRGLGAEGNDFRATVYIYVFDHPVTRVNNGLDAFNTVKASWKLYNCWPASLAFSDLDAGGNGALVTNLTLMYEGFDFNAAAHNGDNRWGGAW